LSYGVIRDITPYLSLPQTVQHQLPFFFLFIRRVSSP